MLTHPACAEDGANIHPLETLLTGQRPDGDVLPVAVTGGSPACSIETGANAAGFIGPLFWEDRPNYLNHGIGLRLISPRAPTGAATALA